MRPHDKQICPDEVSMSLIRSTKSLRRGMKLTQKMLAENLGITRAAVSCYERGKALPTLPILMKLAVILGVDISGSINWKYYHGQVSRYELKTGLRRYGLTYGELGMLLGYAEGTVYDVVNFAYGFSLECLSKVVEVLERENEAGKFRRKLLAR